MKKFLVIAAALGAIAAAQPASAAVIFNNVDQSILDTYGTDTFGAVIDKAGAFSHVFTFKVNSLSTASASLTTIRLKTLGKDIDFTSVLLDSTPFTPAYGAPGHEPDETWFLDEKLLSPGIHAIHVNGVTMKTGKGASAASYAGTLNVTAAVPEPQTWALMIGGFAGAGAMLRRRRQALASV